MKKFQIAAPIKIILIMLIILPVLTACRSKAARHEFTNYTGNSVKTFEKSTGIKLTKESNGVYTSENVVQVIAPKESITSITMMSGAKDYTVLGIKIGMSKSDAEKKLNGIYGKETSKTINSSKHSVTSSYIGSKNEVYISYDIDEDTVVEMSYYTVKASVKTESKDTNSGELIAMIGKTRVYYNEAMVYLKMVQENYESEYGNGIWGVDIVGDGKSFGDNIKDEVIKLITELKIINNKAAENKVELTEEELADAKAYAKEYYDGLKKEDIDRYLITQELLERIYAENLLAEKMFETLTLDVDTNVTDEEAKQITIQDIMVYSTDFDSKGNKVPLTSEEKDKAYEKINTLLTQAKSTDDFHTFAEANTEADTIEYTFGKGQGPKEYGDAFEQAAFQLKTGEISNVITTDTGWHILYCVSDFNKDATTQVKENMIEERRNEMFSKLYTEWSADVDVVVNNEAWNAVAFDE